MIGSGWQTFVQVGLALARIRDGELYKTEYDSFEAYYRVKWQYGRHYVNRLISAAQVFTQLVTICHQTKPEYESQVRPLVGLTPGQAQVAWERAIEKAGGRKITARLVKAAVQELQPAGGAKPAPSQPHQNKAEQRKLIDGAIGELLMLLSQKASHDVLTQKVEALCTARSRLCSPSRAPRNDRQRPRSNRELPGTEVLRQKSCFGRFFNRSQRS